jgi:hypothetical protein
MGVFFNRSVTDTIFAVLFLPKSHGNRRGPQFEKHYIKTTQKSLYPTRNGSVISLFLCIRKRNVRVSRVSGRDVSIRTCYKASRYKNKAWVHMSFYFHCCHPLCFTKRRPVIRLCFVRRYLIYVICNILLVWSLFTVLNFIFLFYN